MRSLARKSPAPPSIRAGTANSRAILARVINLGLLLTLVNGLARNFGPLSDATANLIAALCLAGLGLASVRDPVRLRHWKAGLVGGGVLALGWWMLQYSHSIPLRLGLVAILLLGVHWIMIGIGSRLKDIRLLVAVSLLFALIQSAIAAVPWLGEGAVALSGAWSRFWSLRILPLPVLEGPSGMGGGILLSAVIAVVCMILPGIRANRLRPGRSVLALAGLLLMNLVFLRLQSQDWFAGQGARPQFLAQGIQLILMLPWLGWLRWGAPRAFNMSGAPGSRGWLGNRAMAVSRRPSALLAACLMIGLGLGWWPRSAPKQPPVITFLDAGYVDWKRPEHGRYGAFETGLFGSVHDYLKAAGLPSGITRDVSIDGLRGTDVLVVINPTNAWAAGQLESIGAFVRKGGALWVLGDHTDIMGSKEPLDELLAPVGIRFQFDSGFPARPEWRDCLSALAHPATHRIREATEAVISVGASLEVRPPSYTVLWGRYGFSDLGNHLNVQGAYLGDYQYQRGEQLGDVPLVAAGSHGRGKVLVFGDTSPLQNAALPYSFQTFVHPCLLWLASKDFPGWIWIRWMLAGTGLAIGCMLVCVGHSRWIVSCSLALSAGLWLGFRLEGSQAPRQAPAGTIALIDRSHGNRISLAPLQPDSIGPVLGTLMRNQFLPAFLNRWSAKSVLAASAMLITAPAASYTRSELEVLDQFVRQGGLLVFNCGWQEKGTAAQRLLDRFGFDVLPVPLGPYPVQRVENHLPGQAQFINAWPVTLTDPSLQAEFKEASARYRAPLLDQSQSDSLARLLSPLTRREQAGSNSPVRTAGPVPSASQPVVNVLFQTQDGHPLVVARRWGEGSIVVIGDSLFLGSDNLENLQYYRKGNLLFLRHLFDNTSWKRK